MRQLIPLILALFSSAALAAEWGQVGNARFGYVIDVPPGFERSGPAPANDDGVGLASADGTQKLSVWGGNIVEGSFESSVHASMRFATADGWNLSYERVTPSWASFSGLRRGMVLYARTILLCGGSQYATFRLEYPERDLSRMDAVIDRLVRTLRGTGDGHAC
jgi:hypothetical protein